MAMKRSSSFSPRFITGALAFAMLGLVGAQALLVRDSLELSEQLFRQQVQESLSSVAKKLEDAEHVADAVAITSGIHVEKRDTAPSGPPRADVIPERIAIRRGKENGKERLSDVPEMNHGARSARPLMGRIPRPTTRQVVVERSPDPFASGSNTQRHSRSWDSVLRQMSGEFDAAFEQVEQGLEETVREMTSRRFAFDRPFVDAIPSEPPGVQVTIGFGDNIGSPSGTHSAFSVAVGNPEQMRERSRQLALSRQAAGVRDSLLRISDASSSGRTSLRTTPSGTSKGDDELTRRARKKISHIQQTVRDLREFTRTLGERVSADAVDSVLRREFAHRNLPTEYVFGIVDGQSSRMVITRDGKPADVQGSDYRTVLFPGDIVQKNHTLFVSFPSKREYLMNKNASILGSSAVFMAIIVGSFGWTMRNLNRHKKISEMKSDFISNMTHELKTPIATIELAADALRDPVVSASTDRVQRFLGVIREENHRLRSQVERVLQAAKMERGELVLNVSDIDMHEVIEEAVDAIGLQLESRGGSVDVDLRASITDVSADEMHMRNVLLNLLDNAIKYSTDAPRITVRSTNAGSHLRVDVTDAGIGISRDNQKRVFERLFRVPTGNVHNVKGFGLGLSYVQSIVEAHGGHVSVESELGKGSTFTIILPCLSRA